MEYLAVSFLVDSGVTNVVWVSVVGWALADWLKPNWKPTPGLIRVWLTVMTIGVGFDVALSLYRSYIIPRDVLQDLVSGQEFLAGRTMYPAGMNARMRAAMEREGPRASLLSPWPALVERERRQAELALNEHWVQAHTPFASLFVVPLLWLGDGILGAQILFTSLSLAAFAGALVLLCKEFFPTASNWRLALLALGALGWDATVVNLRTQNWTMLLEALVVGSWFLMTRGVPSGTGILVGLATNLKLVPGLLFLPFLLSHRRAAAWAVGSTFVVALATLWIASADEFRAFVETARDVVTEYAGFPTNISLLGVIVRCGGFTTDRLDVARLIWFVVGASIAVGFALTLLSVHRRGADLRKVIDAEFALASTLMPILSPIAWADYLLFAMLPLTLFLKQPPQSRGRFFVVLLILTTPCRTLKFVHSLVGDDFFNWCVAPLPCVGLAILAQFFWRRLFSTPGGETAKRC